MTIRKQLLIFLLALAALCAPAAAQVVDEIVAIVNDDIITLSQVRLQHDIAYQALRSQLKGQDFEEAYTRAKAELLNNMITEILLLQLAREKDLNPAEAVKSNLENLKKENNLQSDEELRRVVEAQGMSYEVFIKQMEETMMKQMVVAYEVDRSIVVEDAEVANYYKLNPAQFTELEEYKLKAIFLSFEGRGEEAIEARKKDISDKLKAGEDFAAVAAELSDNPMKDAKGDLGSFKKGQLEESLQNVVAAMKKGDASSWIKARNGWYLLQLEERKESRLRSFEEVKREVEEKLATEKRNKKLSEFLKQLKAKSYIKILKPNPLDDK